MTAPTDTLPDPREPLANQQHERFALEYVQDQTRNATRAYRAAGYQTTAAAARTSAARLLRKPEVKARIKQLQRELADRVVENTEDVVRELTLVAHSDISHYVMNPETGKVTLAPGAPRDAMKAVKRIHHRVRRYQNGDVSHSLHVELWDKNAALRRLGQYTGGFLDRHESSAPYGSQFPATLQIQVVPSRKVDPRTGELLTLPPEEPVAIEWIDPPAPSDTPAIQPKPRVDKIDYDRPHVRPIKTIPYGG